MRSPHAMSFLYFRRRIKDERAWDISRFESVYDSISFTNQSRRNSFKSGRHLTSIPRSALLPLLIISQSNLTERSDWKGNDALSLFCLRSPSQKANWGNWGQALKRHKLHIFTDWCRQRIKCYPVSFTAIKFTIFSFLLQSHILLFVITLRAWCEFGWWPMSVFV